MDHYIALIEFQECDYGHPGAVRYVLMCFHIEIIDTQSLNFVYIA